MIKKLLFIMMFFIISTSVNAIHTTDAIAYYRFEEAAGQLAIDYSGNNYTGNHTFSSYAASKGDQDTGSFSLDMNGVNSEMILDYNSNNYGKTLCTNGCSVCAWYKPEIDNSIQEVVSRWNQDDGHNFWRLVRTNTNIFNFQLYTGNPTGGPKSGVGTTVVNQNKSWTHVCGTITGGHGLSSFASLYVDGDFEGSGGTLVLNATRWENENRSILGGYLDWGGSPQTLNGRIDEILFFNQTLNITEIQEIYSLELAQPPPLTSELEYGICHTEDGKRQVLFFLVILAVTIIFAGIFLNLSILTFIGALMLLMLSFYIIPCIIIIGRIVMFVSILMMAYSVFVQPRQHF